MKLKLVYKGGKGSGNFGHAGRKGLVGGSKLTSGIAIGKLHSIDELDQENNVANDKFLHLGKSSHAITTGVVSLVRKKLSDTEIEHYYPKHVNNGKVHLSYNLKVHPDKIPSRTAYKFMLGLLTVEDVAEQLGVTYKYNS